MSTDDFPDELLLCVFSYLTARNDKLAVVAVCARWRAIGFDATLWGARHGVISFRDAAVVSMNCPRAKMIVEFAEVNLNIARATRRLGWSKAHFGGKVIELRARDLHQSLPKIFETVRSPSLTTIALKDCCSFDFFHRKQTAEEALVPLRGMTEIRHFRIAWGRGNIPPFIGFLDYVPPQIETVEISVRPVELTRHVRPIPPFALWRKTAPERRSNLRILRVEGYNRADRYSFDWEMLPALEELHFAAMPEEFLFAVNDLPPNLHTLACRLTSAPRHRYPNLRRLNVGHVSLSPFQQFFVWNTTVAQQRKSFPVLEWLGIELHIGTTTVHDTIRTATTDWHIPLLEAPLIKTGSGSASRGDEEGTSVGAIHFKVECYNDEVKTGEEFALLLELLRRDNSHATLNEGREGHALTVTVERG